MRLGISINAFNCSYLLEKSLPLIAPFADYVNLVVQGVSNTQKQVTNLDEYDKLQEYVDFYLYFRPNFKLTPKKNETNKRNRGLMDCKIAGGCDMFISIDEDEFYDPFQFEAALERFEESGYDASVCQLQTYYKRPSIRLNPPENYYVPLFYKIGEYTSFQEGLRWPVHADPSRKSRFRKMLIFKRDEIEMHHLSYVRNDIREKLYNQSSSVNFKHRIEEIADYWDKYRYPKPAYFGGSQKRMLPVEKTKDIVKKLQASHKEYHHNKALEELKHLDKIKLPEKSHIKELKKAAKKLGKSK